MTFQWLVTAAALVAALLAWSQARRTARRLEQLSQMYWELKFQQGEQRVQVERLSGGGPKVPAAQETATPPGESFVPLASLRR
ncbi:MAG: hypothetical protein EXQ48_00120 [Acidobacteria bacterium]|nr:hypothetical protein [Acidobacteriota bacterium]